MSPETTDPETRDTYEDHDREPDELSDREHAPASSPGSAPASAARGAARHPEPRYEPSYDHYESRSRGRGSKSPLLAAFFSLIPGLGNVYNGLYARGFVFFLLVVSLFYTVVDYGSETGGGPALALLIPSMVFVWLFNIFDAYRQATLINVGGAQASPDLLEQSRSGTLAAGVALFVLGLYGLLEQFFDIDLTVILDYWWIGVMALGAWMIWQARANGGAKKADEAA